MEERRSRHRKKKFYQGAVFKTAGVIIILVFVALIIKACIPQSTAPPDISASAGETVEIYASPQDTPAPSQSAEIPTTGKVDIRINAVGNIIIQSDIIDAVRQPDGTYAFDPCFAQVKAFLSNADMVIGTLEGVFAGNGQGFGTFNRYNMPDETAAALKNAGFTLIDTASEHALDYGYDGMARTGEVIRNAGMTQTGMYTSAEEYASAAIINVRGVKVAVLSYTYGFNDGLQNGLSAGQTAYAYKPYSEDVMKADIAAARVGGADIVILSMHWGSQTDTAAPDDNKNLADDLINSGADIILGSNPYYVQNIQRKTITVDGKDKDVVIAYSMGNFISSQRQESRDYGIIFGIDIEKDMDTGAVTLKDASYTPVWVQEKDPAGDEIYRLLLAGVYAQSETRPDDISTTDFDRMKQVWTEVTGNLGDQKATPVRGG